MYVLTFLILGFLLVYAVASRKPYSSPAFLWIASFFVATSCALIGQLIWDNEPLHEYIAITIICSTILFVGVYTLVNHFSSASLSSGNTHSVQFQDTQPFTIRQTVLICVFGLVVLCVYLYDVQQILILNGWERSIGILDIVNNYREYVISVSKGSMEDAGGRISLFSSIGYRAYEVVLTIAAVNFFFLEKTQKKENWAKYFIILILGGGVLFLAGGSRSPLMHLFIAVLVAWLVSKELMSVRLTASTAFRLILVIVILLVLFSALSLVRGEQAREGGLIGYLTFFFGSGITSLNHAYIESLMSSMLDPLSSLRSLIERIGLGSVDEGIQWPWINYVGNSSNVFTAYSSYLKVAGLFGALVYAVFVSGVFSLLYKKVKQKSDMRWVIVYCFFSYVLIDGIRSDALSSLIGIPLIEYGILLYFLPMLFKSNLNLRQKGKTKYLVNDRAE